MLASLAPLALAAQSQSVEIVLERSESNAWKTIDPGLVLGTIAHATGVAESAAQPPATTRPTSYLMPGCARADLHGHSVARVWDEAMLDAIRRDLPAPTTHARNLFHVSAAMWDAWAAYDPKPDGYFVTEKHRAVDALAAREAAISFSVSATNASTVS